MESVLVAFMEVAATLASLNLVFLGIVYSAFQANRDLHRGASPGRYRALALGALGSFVVGVGAVALAGVALLAPVAAMALLIVVAVLFFGQLVALVTLAVAAVRAIR